MANKKVAVIMGSDSDFDLITPALKRLKEFEIEFETRVISAHRTPALAIDFAKNAYENGFACIIAAAGKAAHLAGVIASSTALPVIGLPINCGELDGLDALLATVQMPAGVPVASVGINNADNAALLAIQILASSDNALYEKLLEYKRGLVEKVEEKDKKVQLKASGI